MFSFFKTTSFHHSFLLPLLFTYIYKSYIIKKIHSNRKFLPRPAIYLRMFDRELGLLSGLMDTFPGSLCSPSDAQLGK